MKGYEVFQPMGFDAFSEYIEKKQYRVLLDEVSAIEDSEALVEKIKEKEEAEADEQQESNDDLINMIVNQSQSSDDNTESE